MIILGLNAFHADSSAALIRDGVLVAAAEEERFRRIKHWAGFPSEAIAYCLREAGLCLKDVDHIAVNQDSRANLLRKVSFLITSRPNVGLLLQRIKNRRKREGIPGAVGQGRSGSELWGRIPQHRAPSRAFVVGLSRVAVRGGGRCFDRRLWRFLECGLGHRKREQSISGEAGVLSAFARHFLPGADAISRVSALRRRIQSHGARSLRSARPHGRDAKNRTSRFQMARSSSISTISSITGPMCRINGPTVRPNSPISSRRPWKSFWVRDVSPPTRLRNAIATSLARSRQCMKRHFFILLGAAHRKYGLTDLALAGGCAMNSVANGKVRRMTPFQRVYVQAAAGDAGGAIGAAFAVWHKLGGKRSFVMDHAYWGPQFSAGDIQTLIAARQSELDLAGCSVESITDEGELCRRTAAAVADGKVVGWFQGRMEWGPRALGNRSIICDPRRADMKAILNAKIKRRESFRPFAPSVLEEEVSDWFEEDDAVPFMMQVFQIREEKRNIIPAVTHVDGSGRLQTVSRTHQSAISPPDRDVPRTHRCANGAQHFVQ